MLEFRLAGACTGLVHTVTVSGSSEVHVHLELSTTSGPYNFHPPVPSGSLRLLKRGVIWMPGLGMNTQEPFVSCTLASLVGGAHLYSDWHLTFLWPCFSSALVSFPFTDVDICNLFPAYQYPTQNLFPLGNKRIISTTASQPFHNTGWSLVNPLFF